MTIGFDFGFPLLSVLVTAAVSYSVTRMRLSQMPLEDGFSTLSLIELHAMHSHWIDYHNACVKSHDRKGIEDSQAKIAELQPYLAKAKAARAKDKEIENIVNG